MKNQIVLRPSHYHMQCEALLYGWRDGHAHFWCGATNRTNVWHIDRHSTNEFHPTQKPLELIRRSIEDACPVAGVVFDPFLGSGSTIIAAEQLGRRCCGIEIEPRYCEIAISRWESYTGKAAHRLPELTPDGTAR